MTIVWFLATFVTLILESWHQVPSLTTLSVFIVGLLIYGISLFAQHLFLGMFVDK